MDVRACPSISFFQIQRGAAESDADLQHHESSLHSPITHFPLPMTWRIPLSELDYGPEEEAAASRVLRSRWLSMGPETTAFENEFAVYVGTKHAVAVSNGTAALHLAFLALGIGPGHGIIQPAVNFVASANMTKAVGAVPLFADICSCDEPTISPESISCLLSSISSIPSAPPPKAVIVMHYGGYPCRMAEISAICKEHGLALIEDACHAIGARYLPPLTSGVRPPTSDSVGSLGDIACFSFFSNKNLATGEGGMITTCRDDLAEKVRLLRSHGMSTLTWDRHQGHAATYDVLAHGYNYRMDDLRSAIGREQIKKLERNNQRRREITALYWEKLAPLERHGWTLPFRKLATLRPQLSALESAACHLMPLVAPDPAKRWRCAEILKQDAIQTSLHYPFIPGFSAFRETYLPLVRSHSASFCERVTTLPLYPTMTKVQTEAVCNALASALGL